MLNAVVSEKMSDVLTKSQRRDEEQGETDQ